MHARKFLLGFSLALAAMLPAASASAQTPE